MSAEKKASILEQLQQQHAQFSMQLNQAQVNIQQLIGALHACEMIIKNNMTESQPVGDQGNGETDSKQEEQVTQE